MVLRYRTNVKLIDKEEGEMKAQDSHLSSLQTHGVVDCCVRTLIDRSAKGSLVLLSCLWVFGCSTPAETKPDPSKEEIRRDADRFFEKMEREKHGE